MARFEPAKIVAAVQSEFFPGVSLQEVVNDPESSGNLATPASLLALVDALHTVTEAIAPEVQAWVAAGKLRIEDAQALEAWRERLDAYTDAVKEAAAGDKVAVFDSVTAPLLMGLMPGEQSSKVPDVATPFILGNMVDAAAGAREEQLRMFFSDLAQAAADLPGNVVDVGWMLGRDVLYLLGAAVGLVVLWKVVS